MSEPIPVARWGKDHWSTIAYAETCAVDRGEPDKERMRCDPRVHPAQANTANVLFHGEDGSPTKLRGWSADKPLTNIALKHDDWSCLEDAEAAGLLKLEGTGVYPRVVFTAVGKAVAAALRQHKSAGGTFATFNP